ncbi:Rho-binding antiterminator [Amphritea sp. HPY]|uniref:Rho-binding antiterminator n=1 Tax=Amphritea sp. HPY TaxID=3421652 RepID=UPI003D7E9C78
MDSYKPINCEVHDDYELACLRRAIYQVIWRDPQGRIHKQKLRFLDLEISNSEEFLVAENRAGKRFRIRLDYIQSY